MEKVDKKIKILFVKNITRSFIENDIVLLKKHFDVRIVDFVLNMRNVKGTLLTPFKMIKGVIWSDLTFSWFADTHAFWAVLLSKIFKKKSIVVVGGYEVANVPEINYGLMISPKSARMVKYVLNDANKVIAVSEFTKKEILKYSNPTNLTVVYNGVDVDKFSSPANKGDIIITVGSKIKLKGLHTFIESAKPLLGKKFIIIGLSEAIVNQLNPLKPVNVELVSVVPYGAVLQYYQKSKVYCQLSCRESFGMALAEAMACECVPVVTNNAALPEVVGDTGFYVPYGDPKATADAIEKALKSNKGNVARERIKKMFPLNRRENDLIQVIYEVMG